MISYKGYLLAKTLITSQLKQYFSKNMLISVSLDLQNDVFKCFVLTATQKYYVLHHNDIKKPVSVHILVAESRKLIESNVLPMFCRL